MGVRALRRISLQQQVAGTVDLGEIEVHYQPIIDLKTSAHDAGGTRSVAPPRSVAGACGRLNSDRRTDRGNHRDRAGGAAAGVSRRADVAATVPGHSDLGVAVNVSAHQVLSGRLVEHVAEALGDSGMPPSALTLEITGVWRSRTRTGWLRSSRCSGVSAYGSPSTTSAPAIRRWAC